jgi:tetrahydromethanopterin S-methyltransferase subunit B
MSEEFWTNIIFGFGMGLGVFILATIVLVFVMKYGSRVWEAKATATSVDQYRKVAEQATAVQQRTADIEEQIVRDLADLRERVTSMEKLLREVG